MQFAACWAEICGSHKSDLYAILMPETALNVCILLVALRSCATQNFYNLCGIIRLSFYARREGHKNLEGSSLTLIFKKPRVMRSTSFGVKLDLGTGFQRFY